MSSLSYSKVWKWIAIDGSEFFTFYGKDFNPNVPSFPSWETATCYQETSSFNLTWFQPWNEVWCYVWNVNCTASGNLYVESSFQAYKNGSWTTTWDYDWSFSVDSGDLYMWYMYFWVDSDEIWDYATQYRIVTNRELWSEWNSNITSFTVSNLSFDSNTHRSWYLRIEWNYLCYTDATYSWSTGYKHKINYDSYTWWSWDPWYIRVPSWTTWYIYYTDAYGVVRRTHMADERYWGNYFPSWAREWSIRVSNGDYTEWYGYLCFIDGNWECRRMWNGTP